MRLLLIASPIGVFALVVLIQSLRRQPLRRPTVSVIVALLLLAYVVGTAALGVFWVAEMALPKFDLHYLLGYCLVLLTIVHVGLQFRVLEAFFRKHSPQALLTQDRRHFRPGFRRVAWTLLGALALTPVLWLVALEPNAASRLVYTPLTSRMSKVDEGKKDAEMWVDRAGSRKSAIEYLYEQSSRKRAGLLARLLHVLRLRRLPGSHEPPPCKVYPGRKQLKLPQPREHAGVGLRTVMERVAAGEERAKLQASSSDGLKLGSAASGGTPSSANDPSATSPTGEAAGSERGAGPAAVSRQVLTDLLHYANGVTGRRQRTSAVLLRAAPSAGARYPTDIYVAVRSVEGLEPGIYYYNAHGHALTTVAGPSALDPLIESVSEPDAVRQAPVTFVLGATLDRTVARYASHSYRYIALDTGHVAANVGLAAAALGMTCLREPLFDDQALASAVGADFGNEGMLLVMPCGTSLASGPTEAATLLAVPRHVPLALPDDPDSAELTRLSNVLTSWRLLRGTPRVVEMPRLPPAASGDTIALELSSTPETDLFEVIARRRSFRDFASRSVSKEALAGVLHDAMGLAVTTRRQRLLELYVSVRAVDGLKPGIYRYLAEPHALETIRLGDHSGAIERASLSQEVLGGAAFVLMLAMHAQVVEQTDGVRGFRHAHLDAGLAGENAYLSAVARGLGVCGVGAFDDREVNHMVGADTHNQRVLFLLGIGPRD